MFWFNSSKSNDELVNELVSRRIIESKEVIEAMKAVDRAKFCRGETQYAYIDIPQPIGSHATISAPHMVSKENVK
jgi:protein-L-isoaspartate(D-aspartate) O-methyltransferase